MTADEVLEEFLLDPCCIDCPASDCINERRMADEIIRLRDRLAAVEAERDRLLRDIQDAERYRCLRALLRHARWDYLDPISEMKPEFEKFVNDDDLDRALDAVIAVGKERAAVEAAEREVANEVR